MFSQPPIKLVQFALLTKEQNVYFICSQIQPLSQKINSFIDQKTHWVAQLDKTNIAKNKAQGIYPPKDPVISLTGIITETVGQKLQAAGPLIGAVVQKFASSSGGLLGGGSAHASVPAPAPAPAVEHATASAGFGIGNLLGSISAVKGFGSAGGHSGYGR